MSDVHEQRSHRDLKAGNVMVSGWDSMEGVKLHLIDWANSRRHDEGDDKYPSFVTLMQCTFFKLESASKSWCNKQGSWARHGSLYTLNPIYSMIPSYAVVIKCGCMQSTC